MESSRTKALIIIETLLSIISLTLVDGSEFYFSGEFISKKSQIVN